MGFLPGHKFEWDFAADEEERLAKAIEQEMMPVHEKVGEVKLERVIFLFLFYTRQSVLTRYVRFARVKGWVRGMQIARVRKRSRETKATFSHGGGRHKCTSLALKGIPRSSHIRLFSPCYRSSENGP